MLYNGLAMRRLLTAFLVTGACCLGCSCAGNPGRPDGGETEGDAEHHADADADADDVDVEDADPDAADDADPDDAGPDDADPDERVDAEPDSDGDGDGDVTAPTNVPIIFVHGNAGSLSDWSDTIRWLVEDDERWDGFEEAGIASYQTWVPGSIPESRWLFNFSYYNLLPSDARGAYTAGPGRIGSNDEYACVEHGAPGYLPATDGAYYDESITHEYGRELAAFVAAVVAVTGSDQVDLVGHSMGGLVIRSAIQFGGALGRARRVLLVAVPSYGIDIVDFGFLDPTKPRWMIDGEFAELDATASWWEWGFRVCGGADDEVAWPTGLNTTDDEAAALTTYFTMSGTADLAVGFDTADYEHAEWHVVVPGVDHSGMLDAPETRRVVRDTLGRR
jgi:pimeloyl-ACP methyl ester carboxylesterase